MKSDVWILEVQLNIKLQWNMHLRQIKMNHVIRMLTLNCLEVFTWKAIFTKARQVYIDHLTKPAKTGYKLIKLASVKNICLVELSSSQALIVTHQQLIASYKRLYLLMTVICSKDINCSKDIMRNTCSLFVRFYIQDSYVIK